LQFCCYCSKLDQVLLSLDKDDQIEKHFTQQPKCSKIVGYEDDVCYNHNEEPILPCMSALPDQLFNRGSQPRGPASQQDHVSAALTDFNEALWIETNDVSALSARSLAKPPAVAEMPIG
jgi:hypothetical protein